MVEDGGVVQGQTSRRKAVSIIAVAATAICIVSVTLLNTFPSTSSLLTGSDIDLTSGPGPNGEPPYRLTGQLVSISPAAQQPPPRPVIAPYAPPSIPFGPRYAPTAPAYIQPPPPPSIQVISPPNPQTVAVSKPLDNLLRSLTADIAQDNLALDSLRTQVSTLAGANLNLQQKLAVLLTRPP
eukprot:CAMPEP_0113701978 /NCGR_PEP_ID=MMETSP0038_2-20120614/24898_1 /TAXON_ID=2898 /ORGANISM="Cryptomonas paramecium" /LENGTH=181 /DNA_ID=CAMNT_0000625977 /DNA_START=17 /DNA_END=559 /DNA_ORIENTATION=+ /assembly_acc=CAM_ASM_000170